MAALSKWVPIGADVEEQPVCQKQPTAVEKIGGIYCHICHLTFGNKKDFDSHYLQHGTGNADIIYTCVICHKNTDSYTSFRGHCYLVHVVKDKFKCESCDKVFSKLCVLKSHIKSIHEIICSICQKQFKSQKDLLFHKIIHNTENGPPYECQTCGDQIETSDDCENHMEDHCSMFYYCPICNEEITDLQNAASHLTKHFGDVLNENKTKDETEIVDIPNDSWIDLVGGILCCYCDSIYKAKPDFDSHIVLDHPDEKIVYACNICKKEFEKYNNLANHGYDHTSKDRFECEECFKTFSRLSLLVIHMEAYHTDTIPKDKDRPFTCLHCDHAFATDRRLKEHYHTAHDIYHSQCHKPGCGKTFDTPKDLIFHLKQHNSVQNWCKQCGLPFFSLQACKTHLQYHKKKLYSCPICNKKYPEKYLALKHLPQHFSAVFHVCKVCGKVYNNKGRFVQHLKVHNEVKAHICSFCEKGFTKIYALKQHLNIHTGLKPYKCTNCPKTFASAPNLRKHQRSIHNVTMSNNKNTLKRKPKQENSDKVMDLNDTLMDSETSDHTTSDTNNVQEKVIVDLQNITSADTRQSFEESNESVSQWMSDEIEPIQLEMLEENLDTQQAIDVGVASIDDFHKDLWTSSTTQLDSYEPLVPREYGPEFVFGAEAGSAGAGVIPLGDPPLPHIDPRLTLLHPPNPPTPISIPIPSPKWEPPIITKLDYYDYDTAMWDQITI